MSDTVLVLRTCQKDMSSWKGTFTWPASGHVECPDWDPEPICGNGLHGLLWGTGDGALLDWSSDAKWLVVEVLASDIVKIGEKVKFPKGNVIFCGSQLEATKMIYAEGTGAPAGFAAMGIVGLHLDVGHHETAIVGYKGVATAGSQGSATAGDSGTATAGAEGTATAGDCGTATAGAEGRATAGDYGTATAGSQGSATAGYKGTATAGNHGTISIKWWDENAERYRLATGYIGENGLEPNTAYKLADEGKFVKVV